MNGIVNDLTSSAKSLGINIIINDTSAASAIISTVIKKYINESFAIYGSIYGYLWEHTKDALSVRDGNAWKRIPEFISEHMCIMFFNSFDEKASVTFMKGEDVGLILGDMYGFEFYLTNEATEYLLCYNHHDYLIACGTAKDWLVSYSANSGD